MHKLGYEIDGILNLTCKEYPCVEKINILSLIAQ